MDVAKRQIEELGGNINVSSESGKGAVFTISMPKTVSTQIIHGYIIIVNSSRYVLPLERVVRCFRPNKDQLTSILEQGSCVSDGEKMLDVYDIAEIFGVPTMGLTDYSQGIMVVVETKKGNIALHVDKIEGVQQIVLKEIEGLMNESSIYRGGAVMGDGSVAMVVDMDKLFNNS